MLRLSPEETIARARADLRSGAPIVITTDEKADAAIVVAAEAV